MNIFRLTGDMLHLLAILILLYRIRRSRNCIGLSCKTQEMYLLVFCIRYLDLFMYFISLYNTGMKVFFISATAFTIYLMRYKKPYCTTYDALGDDFPHFKVLLPAAFVITLLINTGYQPWEFVWSYSLWLESIAFIPQIVMLNKIRLIENITSHYVATLGLYRFFYILNWFYRFYIDDFFCWTQILSGILQTGLYVDFLYYYFKSIGEGKQIIELPM
ncbi:er lumen protein retaining receptor [Stylonychia lemnae]|uniref:Er lumen protein retaining receptor n=1 Tax=Stylonychia lemnae TaxID=5949 RepID=A0A078B7V9_STYLE|nr:er lumen protein retaining receptor [Stylonychia lemnae]|eukprot:CDW90306.1 er lumen protein retaining receptor [Stylonychia lemnae]